MMDLKKMFDKNKSLNPHAMSVRKDICYFITEIENKYWKGGDVVI